MLNNIKYPMVIVLILWRREVHANTMASQKIPHSWEWGTEIGDEKQVRSLKPEFRMCYKAVAKRNLLISGLVISTDQKFSAFIIDKIFERYREDIIQHGLRRAVACSG